MAKLKKRGIIYIRSFIIYLCLFYLLNALKNLLKRFGRKRYAMGNMLGKNVFRKILSNVEDMNKEKQSFRKGLAERLSTPLKGNNTLERVPGHDMLAFE